MYEIYSFHVDRHHVHHVFIVSDLTYLAHDDDVPVMKLSNIDMQLQLNFIGLSNGFSCLSHFSAVGKIVNDLSEYPLGLAFEASAFSFE